MTRPITTSEADLVGAMEAPKRQPSVMSGRRGAPPARGALGGASEVLPATTAPTEPRWSV